MPIQELKQTYYQDATDFNINHDTQDHRQDMTHYHVPLMRMHNTALHRWGIAVGLQVAQTGPAELTIAEGLATDAQGRMLPLAAEGATPGQPGQAFLHNMSTANLVNVPVVVSTQGMVDGAYYATLELATTTGPEGQPVEGRFLSDQRRIVSTLLVKLQPTTTFTSDGTAIILATVALVGGAVTSLSGAERQLARLAVGEVVVHHGAQVGAGPQVGDAVSGRIAPLATGGVQVTVPGASDKIVLQQEGNHNFQELTVRADHLRVMGSLEVAGVVKLQQGTAINEFSSDGKLADNSDAAVPTERAVKEYIDNLLAGCVAAFATTTPPPGWLECNAQAISRTQHARLFARISTTFGQGDGSTTFNVPDLRGLVIRGWDHGSGPDGGRSFGSYQGDAFQDHQHSFSGNFAPISGGSHSHVYHSDLYYYDVNLSGGGNATVRQYNEGARTWLESHSHGYTPSGSVWNATTGNSASETRIKNRALMYCIKS